MLKLFDTEGFWADDQSSSSSISFTVLKCKITLGHSGLLSRLQHPIRCCRWRRDRHYLRLFYFFLDIFFNKLLSSHGCNTLLGQFSYFFQLISFFFFGNDDLLSFFSSKSIHCIDCLCIDTKSERWSFPFSFFGLEINVLVCVVNLVCFFLLHDSVVELVERKSFFYPLDFAFRFLFTISLTHETEIKLLVSLYLI